MSDEHYAAYSAAAATFFALVFTTAACSGSGNGTLDVVTLDRPQTRALREIRPATMLPAARTAPLIALPHPLYIAQDSFRTVAGVTVTASYYFVLDRGREPHLTQIDSRSGRPVRRFLSHVIAPSDTVFPVGAASLPASSGSGLLVNDGARPRLIALTTSERHALPAVTVYDLRLVFSGSDNPTSIASAPWGVAIAGTLTRGTEFAYSEDLRRWQLLLDTTGSRFGRPVSSFVRSLALTKAVGLHPAKKVAVLASVYSRSLDIVDLTSGEFRHIVIDSVPAPPATLELGRDSSVRIVWAPEAKRHFVSVATAPTVFALLDCGCGVHPDTATTSTSVWLFSWDGQLVARLKPPRPITSIVFSSDYRHLVATERTGEWVRLVSWPLSDWMIR